MSDEVKMKACPFCGSNDVRLDYKVAVCDCCGSEAFHAFWNRRVVTREQVEKMAEALHDEFHTEDKFSFAQAHDDVVARYIEISSRMLRAAGFEVAE